MHEHRTTLPLAIAVLAGAACMSLALVGACSSTPAATKATAPTQPKPLEPSPAKLAAVTPVEPPGVFDGAPHDYAGVHNVVTFHEGFYSGGVPEGDAGFATLAGMGVKTVISVDGAAPDAELARQYGLRYIHLPIGYNGFDEQRKLELVRATRDAMQSGPVYIHCHHGKHRSAGAAATIAASLGWADSAAMIERMKVSGTAPDYRGLYACAANATVIDVSMIDAVKADFPEVSRPRGFVKGMVEIDETMDNLKAIEKAGWATPRNHPDLVPAAEAGRLADVLRVLADGERARREPADFAERLRKDSAIAQGIEDGLASGAPDAAALSARFKTLGASCKDCHAKYRD